MSSFNTRYQMLVLYNWSTKICTLVNGGTQMVVLDGLQKRNYISSLYMNLLVKASLDVQPWSPPLEQAILWLLLCL
jgi:hypothetical protein